MTQPPDPAGPFEPPDGQGPPPTPPQQPGYPSPQPGYPPQQPGYPPQQPGYPSPQQPGYPQQPGFPPPVPAPTERFFKGAILAGALTYLPCLIATAMLAGFLSSAVSPDNSGTGFLVVLTIAGLLPVVPGVLLAVRGNTPWKRGFGLGLAIGWAVWGIVGGGACLGIIAMVGGFGP